MATSTDYIVSYDDPFFHPSTYSPTDKETIDTGLANARKIITPHTLVLQMLFNRLQAARYHRPAVMLIIQQLVLRTARAFKTLR
jgi:phosphatidylinositol 4-kinase